MVGLKRCHFWFPFVGADSKLDRWIRFSPEVMAGRRPRVLALLSILLGVWSVAFVNSAYKQTTLGSVTQSDQHSPVARYLFGGGGSKEVEGDSIYDFKVQNIDGQEVSLNEYNGKVVLIVNVASK